MFILDSVNIIVEQQIDYNNEEDVAACFEQVGHDRIIDLGNNLYLTYQMYELKIPPVDLRIPYGVDMFVNASQNVAKYGYAVAVDAAKNVKAVIRYLATTFLHSYTYSGSLDLTFLNGYDCIFLMGCNEFSVEICRAVLPFWEGKRLVLIGEDWNDLIEYLPDIPEVECFYDLNMDKFTMYELTIGMHSLYIKPGFPHQESQDRYVKDSVMYYDEIMALTYMFSDYRELGEQNPDKAFFVLDVPYDNLGLFTLFSKASSILRYVKAKNFIPVVNLTRSSGSMYSDYHGEEIWNKFYNQPEGYTIEEVLQSKHVYFSPLFYNGSVLCHIMDQCSPEVSLSWLNGIYNSKVVSYLEEKQKVFLPYPDKTLGVLARGTDYVNTKLPNHAIHASLEMLFEKIDAAMAEKPYLEYIYVASEDAEYCRKFEERYKERFYCTDQKRFTTKDDEMLAQMHRDAADKIAGYTLGTDYILSIHLLAMCRTFIASGTCSGVWQAMEENHGRWDNADIFIFDLGYT